jgi:hypothetical protein
LPNHEIAEFGKKVAGIIIDSDIKPSGRIPKHPQNIKGIVDSALQGKMKSHGKLGRAIMGKEPVDVKEKLRNTDLGKMITNGIQEESKSQPAKIGRGYHAQNTDDLVVKGGLNPKF